MTPTYSIDVGLTEAIFHRRAVRRFRLQPVEAAVVEDLLRAAVQAPSALNQQPWAFGVYHGRTRLADYSARVKAHLVATYPTNFELNSRAALYEDPSYDVFHGADTLIVIYAKPGRLHPNEDCCLAAENLMLAAYARGLGTCPIGFARSWLNLAEVRKELGTPVRYEAIFPLVVGYPAGETPATPRVEPEIAGWKWDLR